MIFMSEGQKQSPCAEKDVRKLSDFFLWFSFFTLSLHMYTKNQN